MKTLLAILLSFVISEAPVFAIHGGYTIGGQAGLVGTFAGILLPVSSTNLSASGTASSLGSFGSDSLGLFSEDIGTSGVGDGALVIFSGALELDGDIRDEADPRTAGSIIGVINASAYAADFTFSDNAGGSAADYVLIAEAGGDIETTAENSSNTSLPTGVALTGTATVTFESPNTSGSDYYIFFLESNLKPSEQVIYQVDGFQETTAAPASSGTF